MQIEILHVRDCPHVALLRDRLQVALARTATAASVRETEVESATEAARLGMRGSPTILIDGRDPFTGVETVTSLSCRLFRTDSALDGAPAVTELIDALSH